MRPLIANIGLKYKVLLSTLVALLLFLRVEAGVLENIVSSFKSGKVSAIENNLDSSCEITIAGVKSTANQMQAKLLLEGFFSKNTPTDFTITSSSISAGSKYAVGVLSTTNGKFDVYISFSAMDGNVITGIKISN